MSIASHFIHTCTVKRAHQQEESVLGNPVETLFDDVYSGPCRLVVKEDKIWSSETKSLERATSYQLLLPPGADVKERDTVAVVVLETGEELKDAFTMKSIYLRRSSTVNHISVTLERVG
ncbi:conserved hypothetical protein [Gammaproteobacteria bacterium]